MEIYNTFSKAEKNIFRASSAVFCLCLLSLLPWAENLIFKNQDKKPTTAVVGQIVSQKNETLHRYKTQYVWKKTADREDLHLGDSVYAGPDSQVDVVFNNKNTMTVGENSLIIFDFIENEAVTDFRFGNFSLKVDGSIKVAIQGQITEFTGRNSELQIYTDGNNQPKARVIKGAVLAKPKNKPSQQISKNKSLPLARAIASTPNLPSAPALAAPVIPILKNETATTEVYTWKLYDLYEPKNSSFIEKPFSPRKVSFDHTLSWTLPTRAAVTIETSDRPDFLNASHLQAPESSLTLKQVYIGQNFWRAKLAAVAETKNYSTTESFKIETRFASEITPIASTPVRSLPLINNITRAPISLQTSASAPLGFIIQASQDKTFKPESRQIFWSTKKDFILSFLKPGMYFYRFKTVNKNQELSNWSSALEISVFVPEPPAAPRLASGKLNVPLGEPFNMKWASNGVRTRTEITDLSGKKIQELVGTQSQWRAPMAGKFKARAWTVNIYGQESPASKVISLNVNALSMPPKETPTTAQTKPTESPAKPITERKTAAVENTTSVKIEAPKSQFPNSKYNSTEISANGFVWTAFSSEQTYAGEGTPVASGLGIHGLYWKGNQGFEGSIKSGVAGLNDTGTGQSSLKDLEARYHYRFITGSPWGLSRELQFSIFTGVESYRNTSGASFASHYDLLKFGTSLEFPWSSKWTGGGEFVFGTASDSSQKKEVSGHIGYFVKPNWSLGGGYRMHLFDAGTIDSSPKGSLPYREGYGEGYSVLKYHF